MMVSRKIDWPTDRHRDLATHIVSVCRENGIGARLLGSIAKVKSGRYSDIDVSLEGRATKDIVERILFGFEKPLMINGSENPPGLLIVAYRRGLALDLGINRAASEGEIDDSIVLAECSVRDTASGSASLERYLKSIAVMDGEAKLNKLIHKGVLKYLNGKTDEAGAFAVEVLVLEGMSSEYSANLPSAFRMLVERFVRNDDVMREEFEWLLVQAERMQKLRSDAN